MADITLKTQSWITHESSDVLKIKLVLFSRAKRRLPGQLQLSGTSCSQLVTSYCLITGG
jgi:hypothetical protein